MMTAPTARTRRIVLTGGFLFLPGTATAVAAWIGGAPWLALCLLSFYLVGSLIMYLWSGRGGDVAAIMRVQGDERQKMIDSQATVVAAGAVLTFCLAGMMVDLAGGGTGNPWALICAVGGASYAVALAVIRLRH
jgi:hypothetical protein